MAQKSKLAPLWPSGNYRPKAQIMLETLLIVAASGVGSLALIVRELRKAPEGYEDEHGFHIGICAY